MNERLEQLFIERVIRRQEKANERILKEIGKILAEIGELKFSELYSINQQLKYGESLDKIIKTLSEVANINELEIYKMLEKSSIVNLEQSKKYYLARGIDFIPYEENIALQMQVESIARATNRIYSNIALTTGLTYLDMSGNRVTKPLERAYYDIIDEAIYNVQQGKETFDEALKRQLETIGNSGIQSIEYESGHHRRIDSALRMNMQDGLNQLNIKQQEIVGEQFGANMIEVTHHENSAPDHIDSVDGRQFVLLDILKSQIATGEEKEIKTKDLRKNGVYYKGKFYYDFNYINDNLQRHVGTLNCYHRTFTGILGIDEPRYTEEQLEADKKKNEKGFEFEGKHYTLYEGTQLLRKIELEIKKSRETRILAKSSGSEELYQQQTSRINKLINKYHDVLNVSGLKSQLERSRLISMKSV
jgi:hypothetical protein